MTRDGTNAAEVNSRASKDIFEHFHSQDDHAG